VRAAELTHWDRDNDFFVLSTQPEVVRRYLCRKVRA
jgi:hypothetical protein